jgi:hypothetical protein
LGLTRHFAVGGAAREQRANNDSTAMEPSGGGADVSGVTSEPDGALHDLYAGCYTRLAAIVGAISGSRNDAEEAVQEAFVRLIPVWPTLSTYDDPQAWLRKADLWVYEAVTSAWRPAGSSSRTSPPTNRSQSRSRPVPSCVALDSLVRIGELVAVRVDKTQERLDIPVGQRAGQYRRQPVHKSIMVERKCLVFHRHRNLLPTERGSSENFVDHHPQETVVIDTAGSTEPRISPRPGRVATVR